MAFWDEGPSGHAIYVQLQAVRTAHELAAEAASENGDASRLFGRLRAEIDGIRALLDSVDPVLVSEAVAAGAAGSLSSWATEVSNFANNRDVTHLTNAQTHADNVLTRIAQIPINPAFLNSSAVASTVEAFIQTIVEREKFVASDRATRDANVAADRAARESTIQSERQSEVAQLAKLTGDIADLSTQVAQARAEAVAQTATHQQQFSTAQESRSTDFAKAQDERAREHLATLAEAKKEIGQVVAEKTTELDDAIEAAVEKANNWRTGADDLLMERDDAFQGRVNTIIADLNSRKHEADNLVGLIGERGVTSNYQKIANEARIEMYGWHTLTVIALGIFVWVAIERFVPALQGGWNWGAFAGRFFVATALTLFAGYAGAQARSSRDVMRKNRQREMDISAIEPYLATLPEEMRQTIKGQFAARTFVPPEDTSGKVGSGDAMLNDPKFQEILVGLFKTALTEYSKAK